MKPIKSEPLRNHESVSPSPALVRVVYHLKARKSGAQYTAKCPAHEDRTPSLSITEKAGKILLHCHAGCTPEAICAAAGIEMRGLFLDGDSLRRVVVEYDYTDERGQLLYQVVRFHPKAFRYRRPDGKGGSIWNLDGCRRVLYRLPEVVVADTVIICEGEKDVETARSLGMIATCNLGGAGKWKPDYSECLRGKIVTIIGDADGPGRKHASEVARSLLGVAAKIRVLEMHGAKDLSEWIEKGHGVGELLALINDAPEYRWPATTEESAPRKVSAQPSVEVWAERKFRYFTAKELAVVTTTKIDWIGFPYVAAGSITEVNGKIKAAGKTTFVTHLVSAVLQGEDFLGHATQKTGVLYLTEQPKTSFLQALRRADLLDRPGLEALFWADTVGFSWPLVAADAIRECERIGARLLVVAVLSQFAGLGGDSENNAGDAMTALAPLQQAAARGLGVIVVRHERKGGGDVGESGRGSSAFAGGVDIVLSLRRLDGNHRPTLRKLEALSRFDETPAELIIDYTPGGYVALGEGQDVALQEARAAIIAVIPSSPGDALPANELFKAANVPRATGQRAIAQLERVEKVGTGKRGDPFRLWAPENLSAQTAILGRAESNLVVLPAKVQ